eukprot:815228_1
MAVINAINNTNEESKRKELDDHKIFVIGAGLGRTGTGTLRTVLNNLGFKTNHCHAIMHNHHYNEWYYILISITIIIIIEMIFVYYHSKSYSSDVELEGWSGTF